jgi:outer membrane protein assembly factor BamD
VALGAVLVGLALTLLGCPKELPQDASPEELYQSGVEAYGKRNWQTAINALQRFLFLDPGHIKADSAAFLIGESYYEQKQYLTAAAEFLRLAQNRPAGPLADDARFRACQAYGKLSPRPELDQEFTLEAIVQCRSVTLLYPGSPYAGQAAEQVKELTDKLALKVYLSAEYYYKRKAYESAIVYLEHLLENFRGAAVEPLALLKLWEAYLRTGYRQEADDIEARLLREYPDSPEAQKLAELSSGDGG